MTSACRLAPLLLVALIGCATPRQPAPVEVSPDRFLEDVSWLADDARGGRGTGTADLERAAAFVAHSFELSGLEPGGDDGSWLQHFGAPGSRTLGEGNALNLAGVELALGEDWMPFGSTATSEAAGELVFAGYGISDPEGGYDDYAGLDVKGKLVVVLRRGPGASQHESGGMSNPHGASPHAGGTHDAEAGTAGSNPHGTNALGGSPAAGNRYLDPSGKARRMIDFSHKINTAFKAGAAAVFVVNDPASYPSGSEKDVTRRYGSMRSTGVSASLPAVHLTARAGIQALAGLGLDLEAVQSQIDSRLEPASRALQGGEARVVVVAERRDVATANVVGWIPGADPALAHEYVVVGAHMDHLGRGERSGSLAGDAGVGEIHNGADDNASGTAAVMELARSLSASREFLPRSVVFVTFSAEEWGLLGSRHYVDHPTWPLEHCVAMINMDMIGRSDGGFLSVEGMGTSPGFRALVEATHKRMGSPLKLSLGDQVPGNSDHAAFAEREVPIISLFTGLHDDYHRPSDDTEKINAEAGATIASLAGDLAIALARSRVRPVYTEPESPQAAAPANPHGEPGDTSGDKSEGKGEKKAVSGYSIWFGSVPDMTYTQDDGLRISGTRAGSPAEKAGLAAGDLIIALDGQTVRNLNDYAVLLFSHAPGDVILVTIRRESEELELKATLEAKGGDS
jgi:hypothetical protein